MKKARIILGILCVISAVGCGYYVQKSRENIDTEGPKLEAASDTLEVSINATEDELTKDVVAEDKKDGNVSDSIIIENITKKVGGNENQFEITYVGFDKSSNSGRLKRNLVYTDYTKTHFALSQELRFPENQAVSLLDYITAEDCIDGDVSPFIIVDGEENLQQEPSAGIYDCTVSVTNSVGDTVQLPLQVEIYEDSYEARSFRPYVVLTDYLIYHKKGEDLDLRKLIDHVEDQGYCKIDYGEMVSVRNNKGETAEVTEQIANGSKENWVNISQITVNSNVDINQEGVYTVVYSYTSADNGYQGDTRLTVVVE